MSVVAPALLAVGTQLPTQVIDLTPTLVIATAIASRDFEDVHHDAAAARAAGLDNVFLNILTTNGLCQRFVTDWTGPAAIIEKSSVRLGLPAIAGDKLTITGTVTAVDPANDGRQRLDITVEANVSSGRHATTIVTITLPVEQRPPGHARDRKGDDA